MHQSMGHKQVESQTTVYTNTAGHTYSTQQFTPHCVPVHKTETHGHISLFIVNEVDGIMLQFSLYVTSVLRPPVVQL